MVAPAIRPGVPVDPAGRSGSPEAVAAAVITANAVNFGSGYHDVIDKEPGRSGSRTMALRLTRYVEADGLDADTLRALTTEDCLRIFGQDGANPEHVEMMTLFAEALRDLGEFIGERFDGSFLGLVEQAHRSAADLVNSLLTMPLYRDRVRLDGVEVHFYKRAQITAADLARALPTVSAAQFTDLRGLTAFADNLVPHVLLVDGVLDYRPELRAEIQAGRLLPAGGRAEIEIRAAGVHVVELLIEGLHRRGIDAIAMDLDLWLWERGGAPRYKAIARHRTRGPFY